jgi:hypothetical protein
MNGFSGASSDYVTARLGTNVTGCPNIRFTISLKKHRDE